jgi:3-methyladenine DNA glycosylase AlkD
MEPTAERFVHELGDHQSDEELRKIQRYFKSGDGQYGEGDIFFGVRMGDVFKLAERFVDMPPAEIEHLRRHDRINNWDLVDLAARDVVGGYLADRPRDLLYELARSESLWERRTAIVATAWFIREGELDETFAIAEVLLGDEEDLIHKAVGGWLREAGKHDRPRLLGFLDEHAAEMPRTMLRYAMEHLDPDQRAHYRSL